MQRNLDKLVAQENKWKMEFSVNKYRVMHIEKGNLELSDEVWDLRLT